MIEETWPNAGWELLTETPFSPAFNVALDERLLDEVASGLRPPLLRFWGWSAPAVIIGRFQSLRNEVDWEAAQKLGVAVVRRISGGGAMFVQPNWTITYSLYFPAAFLGHVSIADSYALCDQWVVDTLRRLGADVSYAPLNDIVAVDGKVGGAAQVRRNGCILHHTTIAYEMHAHEMMQVLRIGREKLSDKGTPSAAKRVQPLSRLIDTPRDGVVAALTSDFSERFGLKETKLTAEDVASAEGLVQSKFADKGWTAELA